MSKKEEENQEGLIQTHMGIKNFDCSRGHQDGKLPEIGDISPASRAPQRSYPCRIPRRRESTRNHPQSHASEPRKPRKPQKFLKRRENFLRSKPKKMKTK